MRSAPDTDCGFTLRLERSMQGLAGLAPWVDQLVAAWSLPAAQEYALRLCLEEAVANLVMHGTPVPGGPADLVGLRVRCCSGTLHVTIEDSCTAFDPLHQPAPDSRRALEDRPVGGWGIHLMRQFASSIAYHRIDGINRLQLTIGRDAA